MTTPSNNASSTQAMLCLYTAETVMMINTTAFNVALPDVSESLDASMAAQQWIVSSYNLTFAAVVLIAGFLGDRLGHLNTMLAGLAMFVIASVIGIFVGNIPVLLIARALMGAGAGIVIPMGQALLSIIFHGSELSHAMTAWAIAGTLGVPFGPIVGGAITAMLGWRGIFGFDAVVFFAVMVLIYTAIAKRDQHQLPSATPVSGSVSAPQSSLNIPWLSVLLMFTGFSAFSAGLIDAQHSITAPSAWIPMLAGAVLIIAFVAYDQHNSNPLMELSLMHNPSFAANAPALLMLNFSMYGIIFIMPAYLETVMGHGAFIGGLLLMPLVVASIIGSLVNSQIASRIGYRTAAIISLLMLAAGMAVMGVAIFQSGMTVGWFLLIAGQVIAGLGLGAGQPVMLTWAMDCVPAEYSGAGSSLLTVFRQFGSIIGVGIFGSIAGNV